MRVTLTAEARMRGDHKQQAPMWSYISPEQRIPQDHPLRPLRPLVDAVLKDLSPGFSRLYAKTGRPSVGARAVAAGVAAAGALQYPQRAAAHGAARLQPALSLVRGPEHGRPDLGRQRVHEESSAAVGR